MSILNLPLILYKIYMVMGGDDVVIKFLRGCLPFEEQYL